jgi:hypothetical protein
MSMMENNFIPYSSFTAINLFGLQGESNQPAHSKNSHNSTPSISLIAGPTLIQNSSSFPHLLADSGMTPHYHFPHCWKFSTKKNAESKITQQNLVTVWFQLWFFLW